ncbi:MAG: AbiV family abortive infection protein [Rhodanobacter sp.]|nr:AbiV family abortive infection protein [Rhodanobacter sp.]
MGRLNPSYQGELTALSLAAGMNAAVENAARLFHDAETLCAMGSFPTCASLAILSIEESGKVAVLREMSLARSPAERKECWKAYRSHRRKNVAWFMRDLVESGARTLDELYPLVDPDSDHPAVLDQFKQAGFYTDCLNERSWSLPATAVTDNFAKSMLSRARALLSNRKHTAREVELWVEHIGPVWKSDMDSMKRGVLGWQDAMLREGLTTEGAITMRAFLFGPVVPEC